jgi:cysteine desulfurase / selenocysteine lyase
MLGIKSLAFSPRKPVMYDLESLRQSEFPLSANNLYFNHAGISPLPQRSRNRMQWAVSRLAEQPTSHFVAEGIPMMESFSRQIAAFVNAATPEEIEPVTTTSAALNAVALSIDWQAGDNVLFCDVEFPSNAFPWLGLARQGVDVRQLPALDGGLELATVERYLDRHTRLVAASAVQFFSGHRTDLAAIGNLCRERGILFVVDGIQSLGHIPCDVQAMKIDVLAAGGQKSLLGPPGTGFLYVREEVAAKLQPRTLGPNATVDYLHWLDYNLKPLPGAHRFRAGTPNLVGMFGLLESINLLQELGLEEIERHTSQLTAFTLEMLSGLGYQTLTVPGKHGPIATFASGLSNSETDGLVAYLAENNVTVVKHLNKAGAPHVRVSFHCYNTVAEVERLEQLLRAAPHASA